MINIKQFVEKYGKQTFVEKPLYDVDALVLAELAMINFDEIDNIDENHAIYIKDIVIKDINKITYGSPDAKNNGLMLKHMMKSKRYKDLKVGYSRRFFDEENAIQFYAISLFFPNGDIFFSFRGTDITLAGWKEDFYLSFKDVIESQNLALEYVEDILKEFPNSNFYLGGHSKGGNLANYVALNIKEEYIKHLIKSYSFDGPGFKDGTEVFPNYQKVKSKIKKFMTNNDMIGMIFNNIHEYEVIYSTGFLLGGHDPFKWQIHEHNGKFVKMDKRSYWSRSFSHAFSEWIITVSDDDKKLACDVLFTVLKDSKNIYDLLKNLPKHVTSVNKVLKNCSEDERKRIKKIITTFLKQYLLSMRKTLGIGKSKKKSKEITDS